MMAGLLAGAATPLWAEAPATSLLPRRRGQATPAARDTLAVDRLIAEARLQGATVGFALADATTGEMLESGAADQPLPPASVMKALTAAYALNRLGPAHRFRTQVLATAPLQGGRVDGDLVLVGGGDPTLDTDRLGDLVARLAATGLRQVSGRLLYWDAALPQLDRIDAEQPEFVGYNPALGGLNLNFNRVHFEWRQAGGADWALTMDARAERFVPPVRMARMRVERRTLPLFTYEGDSQGDRWTVASEALGKGGARWLPVRHPGLYAAEVFRTLATAQGIDLPEPQSVAVLPTGQVLTSDASDSLDVILRDMLKHSTNITAEVAGLSASGAAGLTASAQAMQDWLLAHHGISARIADHSGLGGVSRISAGQMVRLLQGEQGGLLPNLMKGHPLTDAKGNAVEGHPVQVRAKTGTLNFVSTLAGYILLPGGRRLVFAIFAADPDRRARLSPQEREAPEGGKSWAKRARRLQGQLLMRWAGLYA